MHSYRVILAEILKRFRSDKRGQIAVIFALTATVLVTAIGAGLDFSRAYVSRQELSNAATLTCQYSTRPTIVSMAYNGSNGPASYVSNVNAYAAKFISAQNFSFSPSINATPFTYTQGGSSSVSFTASVPTMFLGIVNITTIPIKSTVDCAAGLPQVNDTNPSTVFTESFENSGCAGSCFIWYQPNGSVGTIGNSPLNTFNNLASYTGATGTQWTVMGYCIEIDAAGVIEPNVPDGSHSAELDCDNGQGTAGNSSISNRSYLTAGNYELRYNYVARIGYPDYSPTYICGSTAADLSWANDTNSAGLSGALRTNQINVYLDQDTTGQPPTHKTMDNTQTLAGSNLIDMCVYSANWIQRSVKITVTAAGYYWTSFAADGANDSYGGQLDNIQFCRGSCSGLVQDNFPPTWTSTPNLFEDTLENPTYTQDPYTTSAHAKGGNLANSYGTSGSSSGWPGQTASGWAVAPYNEVNFWMQGATQGNQYISLQGWNGFSNPSDPLNRSVARPFLLDPGYYSVSYDYNSLTNFAYSFVYSGNYYPICTANPTSADSYSAYGLKQGRDYPDTNSGTLYSQYLSTNFLNVYMAHGALVSTPNINSTLGGAASYTNPDGSVTASPTTPLDNGSNFAAYSASAVNPVIDTCYYSGNYTWVPRTLYVKITKPGWYWLDFSALGDPLTGLGAGAAIDDVKLTAVSSLYGSSPSSPAAIPAPSVAPGSTINFTGFSIIGDPLTP